MRLIAAPGLADGRYTVGVDIVMAPGSHTYWMQPGEAGVPPVFAFNGSRNVAKAEVRFPVPSRINEDGIEAFGYTDKVVFPVSVTPIDPAKPAVLKADVTYAVCHKICIPAHGTATLALTPDGPGLDGGLVTAASGLVPDPASDAERHALSLTADEGTGKPSWTLTWTAAAPIDDIFAVAPDGYYFETKTLGPDRFKLTASEALDSSKAHQVPVTLTLARKTGGFTITETLDLPVATR